MTYRNLWGSGNTPFAPPPHPQSSGGSLPRQDLPERMTAQEVNLYHLEWYCLDRLRAHHDRLMTGDSVMHRLGMDVAECKRVGRQNSEAIAAAAERVDAMAMRLEQEMALAQDRSREKEERRAAWKEALALAQWVFALIALLGYLAGVIDREAIAHILQIGK